MPTPYRTAEEVTRRVDELMALATQLQDEGRHAEADEAIAEAENVEDLFHFSCGCD